MTILLEWYFLDSIFDTLSVHVDEGNSFMSASLQFLLQAIKKACCQHP